MSMKEAMCSAPPNHRHSYESTTLKNRDVVKHEGGETTSYTLVCSCGNEANFSQETTYATPETL